MPHSSLVAALTLAAAPWDAKAAAECPSAVETVSAHSTGSRVPVTFENNVDTTITLKWLDFNGQEVELRHVLPGTATTQQTFPGHVFRAYSLAAGRQLVHEYVVSSASDVEVNACGDLKPYQFDTVDPASLVLPVDQPCLPAGMSSQWSCTRYLSLDQVLEREPEEFGLPEGHNEDRQLPHSFADTGYQSHIHLIPKVSPSGPGYLRMNFTPGLRKVIEWWNSFDAASKHEREFIPGGYTNSEKVAMGVVSLDHHPQIHSLIQREMKSVLQWWTKLPLAHMATYGVRTYHRGNVLIDHIDREDTHIASAVLQISQSVDEDGGWPLEVLLNDGGVGEVYLQPGQMVLYEGAWLRHGRPMRFRGDNFSNIFVHYRPTDWEATKRFGSNRYYGVPHEKFDTLVERGITLSSLFHGPRSAEL